MWLYTKTGFLAITMNKEDSSQLHVRARVKGDIEHYWPLAKVLHTPDADYLYRTNLPRTEVMNRLAHDIMDIDYTSYKGSIEDGRRKPYYINVWSEMCDMQHDIEVYNERTRV